MNVGESGFTLIDTLVALLLSGIVSLIAIPHFDDMWASFRRRDTRLTILDDLRYMRNEAVAHGSRVIMTVNDTGTSYSASYDEYPYSATLVGDSDAQVLQRNYSSDTEISFPNGALAFDPQGNLIDDLGELTTGSIQVSQGGESFLTVTVYGLGVLEEWPY